MAATVYLGAVARDQLDQAQAVIEQHLVACAVCGTNKPCEERTAAEQIFMRYGHLPRRRPGLTRPAEDTLFDFFRSKP
jgi:hypothetical protein